MPAGVLLFDGDCGFCTAVAGWVRRRLPSGAGVRPWQLAGDLTPYGMTADDAAGAAYWIDRRGRAHRGHLAFAEALRLMGPGWRLAGAIMRLPPFSWAAALGYQLVAKIRHRLPGATPACEVARRESGPPSA
jgi:predicted DCC family thiol-disulfide oxidoreductase YuxK